jgi:hypothetical protein
VLETDAVVILWQALLSARKRIAELEAHPIPFPSEEEIATEARVRAIATVCSDDDSTAEADAMEFQFKLAAGWVIRWLKERLGVK